MNLTQGAASLLTDKYPWHAWFPVLHKTECTKYSKQNKKILNLSTLEEADSSLLKAEQIMEELYQQEVINREEKIKTHLEITSGLYR